MRACSSPPARLRSNSAALPGCPVSRRTPASLTAAQAGTKPSSRSRARSALSCAVARAVSRSPVATATTERLNRFPARACVWPNRRAASIAPSRSSVASVQLAAHVPGPGPGSGTGQGRAPLARSRAREPGHGWRARRLRRSGRGRAPRQRARPPRRGGARARYRERLSTRDAAPVRQDCAGPPAPVMAQASAGIASAAAVRGASPSALRGAHRALGPVVHRVVLRAVELVQRKLDQQIHGLG